MEVIFIPSSPEFARTNLPIVSPSESIVKLKLVPTGEKENLQVILLRDKVSDKIEEGEIKEYLYLTVVIPIVINK